MSKTLLYLLFAIYLMATSGYLLHIIWRRSFVAKASLVLIFAGVILQTALLGHRWWAAGYLRPVEPVLTTFSLLTINRDPGDNMALTGGFCITVGVIFAFFSFYRKRTIGDRPEI